MEKHYLISEKLRNSVLDYLALKPWHEVNLIMNPLIQLPEVVGQEVPNASELKG